VPDPNGDAWWRHAVFYQVYPLSFADSDGDGYGDLDGIRSRLDYLSGTLGVDALWVSPFYESPMRDWGYDVTDHADVDPLFGDLAGAEQLIAEAHARNLRVILDFIPNHTSDLHPWFLESRSSRDSPRRDWYVWRDPAPGGGAPTNWVSVFSGPAWTLDLETGQYYRHTYLTSQPDLNWRNPEVREAMFDVARFWLDRGVDGFRVDAAHQMMKDPLERDNPPASPDYQRPWKDMGEYDDFVHLYDYADPAVHEVHRELRKVLDSYSHDPVSIGEVHIFDLPEWGAYYGEHLDELHMPFNFHLMATAWDPVRLRATIEGVLWHVPVGGWTNWTLGNHDEPRLASRLGMDNARLAAMLLLTLRGTPVLYYGDELGMRDVHIPKTYARDPWGEAVAHLSRDGARTPMQWTPHDHAGFTSATPWLPVSQQHEAENVETELKDPGSMLNLYRGLLGLRRGSTALRYGSLLSHPSSNEQVLVYRREADLETMTVALNLSDRGASVPIRSGKVAISTLDESRSDPVRSTLQLEPREGVIVAHN
jgi:alpha-glucosidase